MRQKLRMSGTAIALVVSVVASAAHADAIDGEWCSSDGTGHLKISGALIDTPGGNTIQGIYDRHAFSYVVPEGENDAGAAVEMRLLSDDAVQIWFGAAPAAVWNRCRPIS